MLNALQMQPAFFWQSLIWPWDPLITGGCQRTSLAAAQPPVNDNSVEGKNPSSWCLQESVVPLHELCYFFNGTFSSPSCSDMQQDGLQDQVVYNDEISRFYSTVNEHAFWAFKSLLKLLHEPEMALNDRRWQHMAGQSATAHFQQQSMTFIQTMAHAHTCRAGLGKVQLHTFTGNGNSVCLMLQAEGADGKLDFYMGKRTGKGGGRKERQLIQDELYKNQQPVHSQRRAYGIQDK